MTLFERSLLVVALALFVFSVIQCLTSRTNEGTGGHSVPIRLDVDSGEDYDAGNSCEYNPLVIHHDCED